MKNSLFYSGEYIKIETKILHYLNKQSDFLSPRTSTSPRATGDAIPCLSFIQRKSGRLKRELNISKR